ncbi:MAG: DUF3971 domain-containing protein, partial [Boseongicola sp.]|nr:DUF3971 domain-containing protein [Boseongicola sp.]
NLTSEPFVISFLQVAVPQPLGNVTANAKIEAKPDGWHVALDAATPEIAPETVIAYWPLNESVETRRWLVENVKAGRIFNTSASVRKRPDEKPEFAAIFDFEDANVRFMDHMPFALNGAGRGVLEKQEFSLFVHRGTVEAKDGGTLDGAGTVFAVSDIRRKPSIGKIDLRAKGSLTAALSVLNNRPIELLRRANRGLDIASGDVDVFAEIALPLKKRVLNSDVVYDVKADIRNSRSATIVDGRVLTSGSLKLAANPNEVRISGPMNLDGVPVSATWSQPLNIEGSGSVVSGTVALSNEALSVFDIPLPADMVGGRGLANFSMRIPPDGPPELELSSDLAGVGLDIGGLGWSKARSQPGTLRVVDDLGASPDIKTLALSANGLDLVGRMRIDEQGTLGPVTFDRVVLDDWLDVQAEITPRGDVGSPAISVTGGRVDLRQLPDGTNGSQSGGARDQSPINFNLDSLVVSEGLQFAPLNGRIDPISTQGLSGTFTGRLNGRTTMN